jgi:hypothetical protein
VLSIMSARQQDIAIQTHGCTAIGNAVSSRIGDLDGSVEAVIGAMKAFPGDLSSYKQLAAIPESSKLKTLQQSCCETLVALAGAGGLHVKIQQANGAAVITSAMLAFPDELPLQRTAVLTLGNLIQNQPIASATVESVGGMHATLAAMVAFPTDLHLQQHGKKTVFVSTFTLKNIALPRQARDKCRENSKMTHRLRRLLHASGAGGEGPGAPGRDRGRGRHTRRALSDGAPRREMDGSGKRTSFWMY